MEVTFLNWRCHPPTPHGEVANEPGKKERKRDRQCENAQVEKRQLSLRSHRLKAPSGRLIPSSTNCVADFAWPSEGSPNYSNSGRKVPTIPSGLFAGLPALERVLLLIRRRRTILSSHTGSTAFKDDAGECTTVSSTLLLSGHAVWC